MNPNLSTRLSLATATACFLAAFAAAAFAGPPAGSYLRPAAPATAASAKADTAATAATACAGCKTTPIVVAKDVGPAGKSRTVWTKVGTKHECTHCSGMIVAQHDGTTDKMVRDAVKCGPMLCCAPAAK